MLHLDSCHGVTLRVTLAAHVVNLGFFNLRRNARGSTGWINWHRTSEIGRREIRREELLQHLHQTVVQHGVRIRERVGTLLRRNQ